MTEISRVYSFIATNMGHKPENWAKNLDGNGNGILEKGELRSYLETNMSSLGCDNNEDLNDLVNKFWRSIDTDLEGKNGYLKDYNTLNSEELETAQKRLEFTIALEEKIGELPAIGGSNEWLKEISELLGDQYYPDCEVEDIFNNNLEKIWDAAVNALKEYLLRDTVKKNEKLQKIQNLYPSYDINEDKDLAEIIKSTISDLSNDLSAENIVEKINKLLNNNTDITKVINLYINTIDDKETIHDDAITYLKDYCNYNSILGDNRTLNELQKADIIAEVYYTDPLLQYADMNTSLLELISELEAEEKFYYEIKKTILENLTDKKQSSSNTPIEENIESTTENTSDSNQSQNNTTSGQPVSFKSAFNDNIAKNVQGWGDEYLYSYCYVDGLEMKEKNFEDLYNKNSSIMVGLVDRTDRTKTALDRLANNIKSALSTIQNSIYDPDTLEFAIDNVINELPETEWINNDWIQTVQNAVYIDFKTFVDKILNEYKRLC